MSYWATTLTRLTGCGYYTVIASSGRGGFSSIITSRSSSSSACSWRRRSAVRKRCSRFSSSSSSRLTYFSSLRNLCFSRSRSRSFSLRYSRYCLLDGWYFFALAFKHLLFLLQEGAFKLFSRLTFGFLAFLFSRVLFAFVLTHSLVGQLSDFDLNEVCVTLICRRVSSTRCLYFLSSRVW